MKTTTLSSICLAVGLSVPTVAVVTTFTGCAAGDQYERSTGEYIDDKSVAMRVKSSLHENEEYKFSEVEVVSFKGVVQLSGFVSTADQKKRRK